MSPSVETTPPPSDRVRLRRKPGRGHHDRATIDAILDAAPLCHVGVVVDGQPYVTPTFHWREGDHLYIHGASKNRTLSVADGTEVCVTVSILDGLVLARSAMHHSANFRSVMILGRAHRIEDPDTKRARLKGFIESLYPGRWDALRPMTDTELKATAVLSLALDEASAKVRDGGPMDDEADLSWPVWSGVIPLRTALGAAVADAHTPAGTPPPALGMAVAPIPGSD
ncbi:pyridoxamine 5'-phosphate oxidase family protein [Roseospira navarrensis]|uniref:Pyridoxamine 5'-phosphate oxidase family protein n=1 Tax=Roseospira navarrensis TaxID=140058 RepID=A0A7X2D3D0_9PROT|nr:pyridoxamine 5'-phosphate oxidase family protein [Roseospira navarrensis]MQX37254.1 pyridoxamine 5'-phosphate oxidase family protein [Roseospira navarrensis]